MPCITELLQWTVRSTTRLVGSRPHAPDLVGEILKGVTHYGGCIPDSQERVDLSRISLHYAPGYSDWIAMRQAEQELFHGSSIASAPDRSSEKGGDVLVCGQHARSDFLKAILRVRMNPNEEEMEDREANANPFESFSDIDLAEMYLCVDWYIALRRIGISDPLEIEN